MTEFELEVIKTAAITGTAILAIVTLIKGYYEYKLSTRQKRIEFYEKLGTKLETDENLKTIIDYLETGNPELRKISRFNRYKFLRYYEDIALIMNSGLLKPKIAHYMFSYYAIRCADSTDFWHDINKEAIYWKTFIDFVSQMRSIESDCLRKENNYMNKLKI